MVNKLDSEERMLPSREVAYHYCVAMYFAQQIEENLRYILDSAAFYGLMEEVQRREIGRCADAADFINRAGLCTLANALKKRIKEEVWQQKFACIESIVDDRNRLAHKFLVESSYQNISQLDEQRIVDQIIEITGRLWQALTAVRVLRIVLDRETNQVDADIDKLFTEIGAPKMGRQKSTTERAEL